MFVRKGGVGTGLFSIFEWRPPPCCMYGACGCKIVFFRPIGAPPGGPKNLQKGAPSIHYVHASSPLLRSDFWRPLLSRVCYNINDPTLFKRGRPFFKRGRHPRASPWGPAGAPPASPARFACNQETMLCAGRRFARGPLWVGFKV